MLTHITQAEFDTQVLNAPNPVIVEFGAAWCAPCKRLEPILETLAQEWAGKISVLHVDVEESPDIAMRYYVMNLPTMILFAGGKELERLVGLQSRERIVEKFGSRGAR